MAHAVHGAIGITAELDLQLYTRRLHEGRADYGAEGHWHRVVGGARDVVVVGSGATAITVNLATLTAQNTGMGNDTIIGGTAGTIIIATTIIVTGAAGKRGNRRVGHEKHGLRECLGAGLQALDGGASHAGNAQVTVEDADDRDGAAAAHVDGLAAEDLFR